MTNEQADEVKLAQESAYHYGWSCGFATAAATALISLIIYGVYVSLFP
jgi:hypothetical protein